MRRVLLTTGGTGGHIFPALAVAGELRRQDPDIEILFAGSLYGPERRLAGQAGLRFEGLPVRGVLGRGLRALQALGGFALAVPRALRLVRRFRPDACAGFGGYAAFAPLLAARLLGVPCVLHEQNALAGVTNRLLARFCDRVCVSLPGTKGFGKRPLTVTGNPVRRAIAELGGNPRGPSRRHLLVVGGSQGAHALNERICGLLPWLKDRGISLRLQTGTADEARARAACAAAGLDPGQATAFIDDMASAYAWADLVLCRAGASTVAELCAAGLPAILVPFPHAAHDHQTWNARNLARAGAARLVPQSELSDERLREELDAVFGAEDLRRSMAEKALALAAPEAAAGVVRELRAAWEAGRRKR